MDLNVNGLYFGCVAEVGERDEKYNDTDIYFIDPQNKLIGQRLSIVEDTPGVTRDRIYSKCEWRGKEFMVVDTGGIEPDSNDVILSQMRRQSELAIEKADVIVFVTDIRCGVTADDYAVAQMLAAEGNELFYHTFLNESAKHNYEIDFLLARQNKICPVEVMSSGYKTHASLDAFFKKYSSQILWRYLIYTKDIRKDQDIFCFPTYMTPFL